MSKNLWDYDIVVRSKVHGTVVASTRFQTKSAAIDYLSHAIKKYDLTIKK